MKRDVLSPTFSIFKDKFAFAIFLIVEESSSLKWNYSKFRNNLFEEEEHKNVSVIIFAKIIRFVTILLNTVNLLQDIRVFCQ